MQGNQKIHATHFIAFGAGVWTHSLSEVSYM